MRMGYLAAASAAAMVAALAGSQALAQDAGPAAMPATAPAHYGTWGVDLTTENKTVNPGDDFFMYTEGKWYDAAVIPSDQASSGVGYDVFNRSLGQMRTLIESAARDPKTPEARQIGALFNAFMDEPRIEALDAKPLAPDLARIAAVADKAQFTTVMGESHAGFGKSFFDIGVLPDPKRPELNTMGLGQDGLGLPDRDYYLTDGFKPQRDAYQAFVVRALSMVGYPDPVGHAQAIMDLETAIARDSWPAADRRDIDRVNNPMTVSELQAYAPGLDWHAYVAAAGAGRQVNMVVAEKSAVQKLAAIYGATSLDTLKAWETFHLVDNATPFLSRRFVDSRFEYIKARDGVQQQRPRWKRATAALDGALGEAVGREYVRLYFPADSRAKMQDLVANLKIALKARIEHLDWMAPSTKAEALKKLAKMDVQVGYPDKFRDYSGLKISADDLYGDMERSAAFEWAYGLQDLNRAVDHKKWGMTPQTVNAYNGGQENKIVFPAGILQAPFFDPNADAAVNYGAIGAIIGHEITHGFDDQGRKIDATGAIRDWWTPDDATRFNAQADAFGAQYDSYEPVKGSHINGKLTMGENIADLGGVLAALDAYHASLHGKPAPVIDGLTGDQRFFLAYAQAWQGKDRDDSLKEQMAADPHSPGQYRVIGPTRNIDAWYAAFDVRPGSKYYLAPDQRVRIW